MKIAIPDARQATTVRHHRPWLSPMDEAAAALASLERYRHAPAPIRRVYANQARQMAELFHAEAQQLDPPMTAQLVEGGGCYVPEDRP